MQPISGKPVGSTVASKCIETRSTCVVWDGPDINCLGVNLCKGQSIDIIIYNTAKKLCEVLDALKIDMVDLTCLIQGDTTGAPTNMQELFNLVISKLCALQTEVTALENTGTTDIMVKLPPCLEYKIPDPDNPGNFITISSLSLIDPVTSTSPIVSYLCTKICQLFSELSALSGRVDQLELTVQSLMDTVSAGVPSADVPSCIGSSPMILVDPQDPSQGAVPVMAQLICDLLDQTGTPSQIGSTNGDCTGNWPSIAGAAPLGNYAPLSPATMEDLGFVNNPTQLWEKVNNLWVTVCDIRNFCSTVKATCCPTMCQDVTFEMGVVPTTTSRSTLTLYLNGSQFDPVSNQSKPATFSFAGTYGICGAAPCWNINQAFSVTVTDGAAPANSHTWNFTGTDLTNLYNGGTVSLDVGAQGLDATTSYTVNFVGNVIAPDYSVCPLDQTKTLTATCISNPVTSPIISDYTYNGLTLNFTPPAPSTATLTGYTFEIIDSTHGNNYTITNVPAGFSTYYLYPDAESIPGNPCSSGCAELMITNGIQENTTYQVNVTAVYNCGNSIPVGTSTITTYVGVTVDISAYAFGLDCINPSLQATLVLIPDAGTLPADISGSFSTPIYINPGSGTSFTVYGKPGVEFGYVFTTGGLKSGYWNPSNQNGANCDTIGTVRCWGPPSLRAFYPGGANPANPCTNPASAGGCGCVGAANSPTFSYGEAGCYDYLYYNITPANTLINTFVGTSFTIDNMWDGNSGTQKDPGIYQYVYTSVDNQQFKIGSTNASINITQNVHILNNGIAPKVTIKVTDSSAEGIFQNRLAMWVPNSTTNSRIRYSSAVQALPGMINANKVYDTNNSSYLSGTVQGIPLYMKIEVLKYDTVNMVWINPAPITPTSTSCPNTVIFVTPDWANIQGGAILGSGYVLPPSFNIAARDRIRISFSAGAFNNNINVDYQRVTGTTYDATTNMYSTVEITQDPFTAAIAGNPGPYQFHTDYNNTHSNLNTQISSLAGTKTNNDVACSVIEFVVTDDLIIDWQLSV